MYRYWIFLFQDLEKIMNEDAFVNICIFLHSVHTKLPPRLLDTNCRHQTIFLIYRVLIIGF